VPQRLEPQRPDDDRQQTEGQDAEPVECA
jgi:hypothetical protein